MIDELKKDTITVLNTLDLPVMVVFGNQDTWKVKTEGTTEAASKFGILEYQKVTLLPV